MRTVVVEERGLTFCIDGVQLSSSIDPRAEALAQSSGVPRGVREIACYGTGLGYLPTVLLVTRPELERLTVYPISSVVEDVMRSSGDAGWQDDPRVTIVREPTRALHPHWCVSPPDLRFADDSWWPLRDRIVADLNVYYNEQIFNARRGEFEAHRVANAPKLARSHSVAALFGSTPGMQAIVVMGGPTARDSFEWIREHRKSSLLVCASTAWKPLDAARITPDIIVVIDTAPSMVQHFEGLPFLRGVKLVCDPCIAPPIVEAWQGPLYSIGDVDIFHAGSVVHVAVDLVVKMGCTSVHFVGADFCYPRGLSHVEGAPQPYGLDDSPLRPRAINGAGDKVASDQNLLQYAAHLERYIGMTPGVRFIRHGRAGAQVQGAEWFDDC